MHVSAYSFMGSLPVWEQGDGVKKGRCTYLHGMGESACVCVWVYDVCIFTGMSRRFRPLLKSQLLCVHRQRGCSDFSRKNESHSWGLEGGGGAHRHTHTGTSPHIPLSLFSWVSPLPPKHTLPPGCTPPTMQLVCVAVSAVHRTRRNVQETWM